MTNVACPAVRSTGADRGQLAGGSAGWPGVIEYFQSVPIPKPTAGIHSATAAATSACFLIPATKDISWIFRSIDPGRRNVYSSARGGVPLLRAGSVPLLFLRDD